VDCGATQKPGRREECSSCGADLHACKNCRFYDATAYNECREPSAERVKEKERSNFCDYFKFKAGCSANQAADNSWKNKLEDLFKK